MYFLVTDLISKVLVKIFGSSTERALKKMRPLVEAVNAWESRMMRLSDAELRQLTPKFKERLKKGETLDDLLAEAFAAVREAARRFLRTHTGVPMRHFDVQIIGGIVLHQGKVAEMATGEGKTLVATLAAYLNALTGKGVHIVTVNDYLARRDAQWMGPVYRALGVSVGFIQADMDNTERKKAYNCDITYGTNNEFGFDYLRDNMKMSIEEQVQRGHYYAIIDEVDSILIDEARTPLIISGPSEKASERYYMADSVARQLIGPNKRFVMYVKSTEPLEEREKRRRSGRYFVEVDEKDHTVTLTEAGVEKAQQILGIDNMYHPLNYEWTHYIEQALRAHLLYRRDRDYIVKEGQVIIVDEFTGRLMPGRVWSDGLHQAVEAKEHLKIKEENQTLATITLQNYFKMYEKLAGMTGTAATEAGEFWKIYKLDVVQIPTNKPLRRTEFPDVVYLTAEEKWEAVVEEIRKMHEIGRPVLVGTRSIEVSEMLSERLKRLGIPHEVLNAKHHEREALIVAQAGQKGAVTIATNMAGRGTDIVLGDGVAELGGLHIVGTERHEARRIDNQLRGRAGRQGDPGSSRFFLSLEDDLLRLFAGPKLKKVLQFLGMKHGVSISHKFLTRAINEAQKKVEDRNFEIRRQLLEYDEVMNVQRKLVYEERQKILRGERLREEMIYPWIKEQIERSARENLTDRLYFEKIHKMIWERVQPLQLDDEQRREQEVRNTLGWVKERFGVEIETEEALEHAFDKKRFTDFLFERVRFDFEDWDKVQVRDFVKWFRNKFGTDPPLDIVTSLRGKPEKLAEELFKFAKSLYEERIKRYGDEAVSAVERLILLTTLDEKWKDHLYAMDLLRAGIHLRSYAQLDPKVQYKKEGFEMFDEMINRLKDDVTTLVYRVVLEEVKTQELEARSVWDATEYQGTSWDSQKAMEEAVQAAPDAQAAVAVSDEPVKPIERKQPKVGRNDPCPCGSGKKYKKCCGRFENKRKRS